MPAKKRARRNPTAFLETLAEALDKYVDAIQEGSLQSLQQQVLEILVASAPGQLWTATCEVYENVAWLLGAHQLLWPSTSMA